MELVMMAMAALSGTILLVFLIGWLAMGSEEFDALVGKKMLSLFHRLRRHDKPS